MQLVPGTIVGNKFRITARIGVGGMGTVFSAEQIELNRTVALKVLTDTGPLDEESSARFLQEAQIISQLHHKNIVSIYAFGQWANTPYIAMEFIAGYSLQSRLQENQPLDVQFVLLIATQICSALSHAHKQGIVHRDLKPANIMLGANGEVTVIDFGFAKIFQADAARRQQQLTEAGCAVGSVLYMSPEQCQGQPVDGRTDIYGLGCVLYHCLTGRPPFDGDHSVAIMFQHVNDQAPRLVGAHTELDSVAELQRILDKAMARDLDSRYQSADEMLHDLSFAAANITSLSLQTGSPSSNTFSQIPDQNHGKPLIAPRLVRSLIISFCILIALALSQLSPLTKSHQAARDNDPTTSNLNPAQYISRLAALQGVDRLKFLKNNRDRIGNFSGRDQAERTNIQAAMSELMVDQAKLTEDSKVSEAFKLMCRAEESLSALPQTPQTDYGKLCFWVVALQCQSQLPISQRSQNIPELTAQFIGRCKTESLDTVRLLVSCIALLHHLDYPDAGFKLCPEAAHCIEQLKPVNAACLLESVHLAGGVGQLAHWHRHGDIKKRMDWTARRLTEKSTDADVLAEFFLREESSNFPNHEARILQALKVTDPTSLNAFKLNVHLVAFYRNIGRLESAERLAIKTLESVAKLRTTQQTETQERTVKTMLYCELTEVKLLLKKPSVEILAVLKCFPRTDQPDERLFKSIYYARAQVLDRNYGKAQEIIDDALRNKSQLNDANKSDNLCNVLVYAGFLAHKRGDKIRAEDYWQSAKSIASKLQIRNPERLAQCQQSIDDYRKARPEPELFK